MREEGQNYRNLTLILRREGKQATFYLCGFFLKTQKTEETTDIIIQQGCADMDSHTCPRGVHSALYFWGQPGLVYLELAGRESKDNKNIAVALHARSTQITQGY